MNYFVVSESDSSDVFNTLEEAKECFENWKDNSMSEGVSLDDSYVEIHQFDDDIDESVVIKKVVAVVDEQQHKDLGAPQENGMEFQFWAKWQEVTL